MAPSDSSAFAIGSVIDGKFRLLRLIGRGGMGAVYEAENTWTGRHVAVKILHAELARDKDMLRRFLQEAQTATRLGHPHIIDVLDLSLEPGGSLYMVQELLSGRDLRQHLASVGRMALGEALDVAIPIMAALAAAHERGVIHRDIKPENIFLAEGPGATPIPKLIDFGISKILGFLPSDPTLVTDDAQVVGTPRYMSPERVHASSTADGRADVWSMGVVLFEMLTARSPFHAATPYLTLNRVVRGRADRLVPGDGVPPELSELVARALEPAPELRVPSMRAFIEALLALPGQAALAERHAAALAFRPKTASDPQMLAAPQYSLLSQLASREPEAASSDAPTLPDRATVDPSAGPRGGGRRWALAVITLLTLSALGLLALLIASPSRVRSPRVDASSPSVMPARAVPTNDLGAAP